MKIRIWSDVPVDLAEGMFASRSFSLYGGHQDEVNCLVFSRDLEILLSASIDGYIRLWNTVFEHLTLKIYEKAGKCHAGITSKTIPSALSIQVASVPWQYRITIDTSLRQPTIPMFVCTKHAPVVCCINWRVETREMFVFVHCFSCSGHTHVSDCLQFSPDSQFIASGAWDCRTLLWDVIVRAKTVVFLIRYRSMFLMCW